MLKASINTRPVFNARGISPGLSQVYADNFDQSVNNTLAKIVDSDILSQDSIEIRHLSAKLGGLGMKCLSQIIQPAWASSWLASVKFIRTYFESIFHLVTDYHFDAAVIKSVSLNDIDGVGDSFPELVEPIINSQNIPTQKELCLAMEKPNYDRLLNHLLESRPEAAAWLVSSAKEGISSWLHCATSSIPGLRIEDEDYKEALRLRLLMPIHEDPVNLDRRCRSCNRQPIEDLHALSCKQTSTHRKGRHDFIRDAVGKFIKAVDPNAQVIMEAPIQNPLPNKSRLVSDITIQLGHKLIFLDIAVTNPSKPSAINGNNGSNAPGSAALAMEKKKLALYKTHYGAAIEPSIIPFVLESTGRLGNMAQKFVDKLTGLTHANNVAANSSYQAARLFLVQRLAVLLVKGNARMIRSCRSSIQILRD
jgi:hypothetical protein